MEGNLQITDINPWRWNTNMNPSDSKDFILIHCLFSHECIMQSPIEFFFNKILITINLTSLNLKPGFCILKIFYSNSNAYFIWNPHIILALQIIIIKCHLKFDDETEEKLANNEV